MNTIDLITQIRKVFQGVDRVGDIGIHEALAFDDPGYPTPNFDEKAERAKAKILDVDTTWDQLSKADLDSLPFELADFGSVSFRYYLPAFLIAVLHQIDSSDHSGIADYSTISALSLPNDCNPEATAVRIQRFEILNNDQARVVALFLEFLATEAQIISPGFDTEEVESAKEALNQYWNKFLP